RINNVLKNAIHISLALDESTDCKNIPHLCLFGRFIMKNSFLLHQKLLGVVPLLTTTTSSDILHAVEEILNKFLINQNIIQQICTDGAPAMVGKKEGFISKFRRKHSGIVAIHCVLLD
ncbi:hypothetical protein SNEBB_005455, partial [Seison nebaliae]